MCLHRIAKTYRDYIKSLEDFPVKIPESGVGYKIVKDVG